MGNKFLQTSALILGFSFVFVFNAGALEAQEEARGGVLTCWCGWEDERDEMFNWINKGRTDLCVKAGFDDGGCRDSCNSPFAVAYCSVEKPPLF